MKEIVEEMPLGMGRGENKKPSKRQQQQQLQQLELGRALPPGAKRAKKGILIVYIMRYNE